MENQETRFRRQGKNEEQRPVSPQGNEAEHLPDGLLTDTTAESAPAETPAAVVMRPATVAERIRSTFQSCREAVNKWGSFGSKLRSRLHSGDGSKIQGYADEAAEVDVDSAALRAERKTLLRRVAGLAGSAAGVVQEAGNKVSYAKSAAKSALPSKEVIGQGAQTLKNQTKELLQKTGSFTKGVGLAVLGNIGTVGEFVAGNGATALKLVAENGKAAVEFAVGDHKVSQFVRMTSLRWGVREGVKGVFWVSGGAGFIGGGLAGTLSGGFLVGAAAGVAVEYIRQVDQNLSKKVQEADPTLTGRKRLLLAKFKQLAKEQTNPQSSIAESLMPNDFKRLGGAAFVGATFGLAGGLGTTIIEDRGGDLVAGVKHFADNAKQLINFGGIQKIGTIVISGIGEGTSQETLQSLHGQVTDLGHSLDLANHQITDLAQQNHDLRTQVGDLKNQLTEAKSAASPAELHSQIADLARENHVLTEQADQPHQQLAESYSAVGPVQPTVPINTPTVDVNTLINQTIIIPEGGTFWNSVKGLPEGWVNPDNGKNQLEVVRGMLAEFSISNGNDVSHLMPGMYDLQTLAGLNDQQKFQLGQVLATKSVDEYFALVAGKG
ncbi:hypothetical protein HYU93_02955 [Candidatus Daviesbacteria bacterium]|nr:hypothetical protein [Candidatus Daviesbacteria bacterium]